MTIVVPYIDLLVSLWGALVVSQFLFVFPAMFHLCTIASSPDESYSALGDWGRSSALPFSSSSSSSSSARFRLAVAAALAADVLLIGVGIFVYILGTYCVLLAIDEERNPSAAIVTHAAHPSGLFETMFFH